ncbi:MAG: hypothetical protein AAEJ52_13470, partial [Myxococcota bacterium]
MRSPMMLCNGKEEIRTFLDTFLGGMASAVEFDIKHQLVDGLVVMHERVRWYLGLGRLLSGKTEERLGMASPTRAQYRRVPVRGCRVSGFNSLRKREPVRCKPS